MKTFLSTLAFLAGNAALAQTDATAVLTALYQKAAAMKSLKASFSLRIGSAPAQKGTFFMKGAKYRIVLPDQEIISDGKIVWTYLKDAGEVQVSTFTPGGDAIAPQTLFTSFAPGAYKHRYIGERKVGGRVSHVIELVPAKNNAAFRKVELAVDKARTTVAGGTVWDKSNNTTAYEIGTYTPNANVSDAQFTWSAAAHPGVEVVDLR